jgi:hypothetical protein
MKVCRVQRQKRSVSADGDYDLTSRIFTRRSPFIEFLSTIRIRQKMHVTTFQLKVL